MRTFKQTTKPEPTRQVRLLACPCCGGAAEYRRLKMAGAEGRPDWVRCTVCHMQTDLHESQRHAAATWNRRQR